MQGHSKPQDFPYNEWHVWNVIKVTNVFEVHALPHLLFLGTLMCLQSVIGFFKWQLSWKTADIITLAHLCEYFLKYDLLWECELILKDKDNVFHVFI